MGLESEDEFDLGYLFVALSPDVFSTADNFKADMEKIICDVHQCPPRKPGGKVFIPGEIFGTTPAVERERQVLEIPEDVLSRLRHMSISLSGGYENNKKIN